MELLRFLTSGSVDDGKSTLIGRMLFDSRSLLQDQIEAVEKSSLKKGDDFFNLALLTDGLKAEREQGITIDVAYKYFSTPKRKFIIADTPGHIQYTRNMVTGASTANLMIILVDARAGIIEQTRRHSIIASLMAIPHLVVCVNKMDLVNWSQETFETICEDFRKFSAKLNIRDISFIPVSALKGDNVVNKSENLPWYEGRSLLHHLEEVYIESDINLQSPRFPVQYVIRPESQEHPDYRAYAGSIASGIFRKGQKVMVLPAGFETEIEGIDVYNGEIDEAFAPMSVAIRLKDNLDISRGDFLVDAGAAPETTQDITANICWMSSSKLKAGATFLLQQNSRRVKVRISEIVYKTDISTLEDISGVEELAMNDIGLVKIRAASAVIADDYRKNRFTGGFILIDEGTNLTSGAGFMRF
ncbi:MAG: 50S ribosome-binding GTPase [Leptospiraceae bacterium]|nr:50S ribosome-binding GTPase [Leptospiraceae bacterium]MCB1201003.1 50S ribosome-binding GTPase [Leptospiraceae bacterium]